MAKFTMKDYFAGLEEIRQRHKQQPLAPTDKIGRIRQAVMKGKGLSKLPKV